RSLARRMRELGQVEPEGFELDDIPRADVALYFPDGPPKLYQLTQWLPVFESNTDVTTLVIVRQVEAYDALVGRTPLRVVLVPRYEDLMALLDRADFHAVVYVNNGWTNFQALSFQRAVHIHVNHGESDKICMVSNQAKAYDKVFVAGEAAVRRHRAALAWFDESHLVRVGRPQLDLEIPPALPASQRITITYAPTWEGEDEANNYSSVDLYGVAIIQAVLAQPNVRVVYKPHPRVIDSDDAGIRNGHQAIVKAINAASAADPTAGHTVLLDADVLGVIRSTNLLIADVSSVTLDHLYLRPDAPIVLTDRRTNREALIAESPVAAAAHIVDDSTIDSLTTDLSRIVTTDEQEEARMRVRNLYFDSLEPGDSTTRFWQELRRAIHEHDHALGSLSRVRTIARDSV
ncbi:MAG: CDP-glycerol glycerophosphotransferase family protein, partial [Actinomycetota bacterium]|nr:CDP-glycerol glycerophosphotransferase family protein [Actinomycetota bacterium]